MQFQNTLAEAPEGEESAETRAHLSSCRDCAALVLDLQAICEGARQLPLEEPGPRVWSRLRAALEQEGLVRETAPAQVRRSHRPEPLGWPMVWRLGAVAAMLMIPVGIALMYQAPVKPLETQAVKPAPAVMIDAEDLKLLQEISQRSPRAHAAYETSLKNVNAYIADAAKRVKENPNDAAAREQLLEAYGQKSMVYEMAMSRSLQ
ncbi:MAG: hypothetical protein ACRD2R_05470 [Terriglobales bacterium]